MFRMRFVATAAALALGSALLPATAASAVSPANRPAATGDDATLSGVACLNRAFCVAVGFFVAVAEGGFVFGLAEASNGSGWGSIRFLVSAPKTT